MSSYFVNTLIVFSKTIVFNRDCRRSRLLGTLCQLNSVFEWDCSAANYSFEIMQWISLIFDECWYLAANGSNERLDISAKHAKRCISSLRARRRSGATERWAWRRRLYTEGTSYHVRWYAWYVHAMAKLFEIRSLCIMTFTSRLLF